MTVGSEHEIPTQVPLLIKRKNYSGVLPAGRRQLCSRELWWQDLLTTCLGGRLGLPTSSTLWQDRFREMLRGIVSRMQVTVRKVSGGSPGCQNQGTWVGA